MNSPIQTLPNLADVLFNNSGQAQHWFSGGNRNRGKAAREPWFAPRVDIAPGLRQTASWIMGNKGWCHDLRAPEAKA